MKKGHNKLGVIHETEPIFPLGSVAVPIAHQATVMPAEFFAIPVLMQGESPECGGYALAMLVSLVSNTTKKLSGSFSYAFEKTQDGVPTEIGTTISAVASCGNQASSCLYNLFPDDGNAAIDPTGTPTLWTSVTQSAIADGKTRLITGRPLLIKKPTIAQIHNLIETYGACILQMQIGQEWWTDKTGKNSWMAADIVPLRIPAMKDDDHYVVAGAYDETKDETWIANAWSGQWALNGFNYFRANYEPYIDYALAFAPIVQAIAPVIQEAVEITNAIEDSPAPAAEKETMLGDIEKVVEIIEEIL